MFSNELAGELRKKIAKIVQRVTHCINDVDREDLASAGFERAISDYPKFDITRGVTLDYFLCSRARGGILDELRRWDILPRSVRFRLNVLEKTEDKMTEALQRIPSEKEIASEIGLSESELIRLREYSHLNGMRPIDAELDEESGLTLSEILADDRTPYAWESRWELYEWLRAEVKRLDHAYRFVVEKYYWEGLLFREIGAKLGVTESRISQIHKEALRRLGAKLLRCGLRGELTTE